jgi:radical SAM superfamily enzyme YgiQ (UPF0313 family)
MPYDILIPNAPIGYLKGHLENHGIKTRNIYWNLLLYNITRNYHILIEKNIKLKNSLFTNGYLPIDFFISYASKNLYEENNNNKDKVKLNNTSFIGSIIPPQELKELTQKLKTQINNHIKQQKLYNTEIAGFTMKTNQWILNYYLLKQLKRYNPDIITIIGGIYSKIQGLEFMKIFKEADFAIWGEGEQPLLQLIQQINKSTTYKKIPNLIYRDKNKIKETYQINPKNLPDINTYPFANHNDYFKTIEKFNLKFNGHNIPIAGIRSCDWAKCKFCVSNEGYFYRERSPENIVQEIEYQSQNHNVDNFMFFDNDFGRKDKKEFYKLLDMLAESAKNRDKSYNIIGDISPLKLEKKVIEIMKKIIIDHVQIGFESTSDSLLKKMRKKHSFINNLQALKLAKEEDFNLTGLNIMRGITSETEEDVIESINNLKYLRFFLNKNPLRISQLLLYKRSPFYEEMPEEERQKWDYNECWDEMKNLNFLSEADRFEFFGFLKREIKHFHLWDVFYELMNQYQTNETKYTWIENKDGSSEIKENGTFHLDKTETEILKFCNTIKKFSDLKNHLQNITENNLQQILLPLKDAGLIYVDKNFKNIISTLMLKNSLKKK